MKLAFALSLVLSLPAGGAGAGKPVLLVHGFAATPQEMKTLGDYLEKRGFSVHYVTLPGHGTNVEDFGRSRWTQWRDAVVAKVDELEGAGGPVSVVGFSMGASLTVLAAETRDLHRIVLVSPAVRFREHWYTMFKTRAMIETFGRVLREVPTFGAMDIREKENRNLRGFIYKAYPVKALKQLMKVMKAARKAAPGVTEPCLIFHSRDDRVVSEKGAKELCDSLGSSDRELVILEDVGHSILLDRGYEKVYDRIAQFLSGTTGRGEPPMPSCGTPTLVIRDETAPGGGVALVAEYTDYHDITVTMNAEYLNMKPDVAIPVTRSFAGPGKYVLATFRKIDPGGTWHVNWSHRRIASSNLVRHDADAVYELPYAPGTSWKVSQGPHNSATWFEGGCAIDWGMPEGTPVHAVREGLVVGFQSDCTHSGTTEWVGSNFVVIRHSDGTLGDYEHLRHGGVTVRLGQWVTPEDVVGYSGNTGLSSGPHLHFAVLQALDGNNWAPQILRFRVRGRREPVELRAGDAFARP